PGLRALCRGAWRLCGPRGAAGGASQHLAGRARRRAQGAAARPGERDYPLLKGPWRCGQPGRLWFGRGSLADAGQVLAPPIEVAVGKQEARHAKYPGGLRLAADRGKFATALTVHEVDKLARGSTAMPQERTPGSLQVQLAPPKQLKNAIVIGAKDAVLCRIEQADIGKGGIEYLFGTPDRQAAPAGLAPTVHIAVLDPAPLVRVPVLLRHLAAGIEGSAAQI